MGQKEVETQRFHHIPLNHIMTIIILVIMCPFLFLLSLSLGQPGKGMGKSKLEVWKAPGHRETEEDNHPIVTIERESSYVSVANSSRIVKLVGVFTCVSGFAI